MLTKKQIRQLKQGYCPVCKKTQQFDGYWEDGVYYSQWQNGGKTRTQIYTCEHLDQFFDQEKFTEYMRTGIFPK